MKRNGGFTLIELLVVIAIIAILAAILFPVFAQARAKARQAMCASNLKQDALAFLQYSEDYDERFPQGTPVVSDPACGSPSFYYAGFFPTNPQIDPDSACGGAFESLGYTYDSTYWTGAIQPYMKSFQVYECPSVTTNSFGMPSYVPLDYASYAMNGILNIIPQNSIVAPSTCVMLWNSMGKIGYQDVGLTNPDLGNGSGFTSSGSCSSCGCLDVTKPCQYHAPIFQPNGAMDCYSGNGGAANIYWFGTPGSLNHWVHANGDNFAFCDGHVKWMIQSGDPATSPFVYNQDGTAGNAWFENPNGGPVGCFPPLFDPGWGGGSVTNSNSQQGTF